MKLKYKYCNILRYWIFDFHELQALIIKIKIKNVMNVEYMKVSLYEMLQKKLGSLLLKTVFELQIIFV